MKKELLSILIVFLIFKNTYAQDHGIIPVPQKISVYSEVFEIREGATIFLDGVDFTTIGLFVDQLQTVSGLFLQVTNEKSRASIAFEIDSQLKLPDPHGYTLKITDHGIRVRATSESGIFYATQTLRQLLPSQIESDRIVENVPWTVPHVDITDYPEYSWRGYMKDVSRTFYSVEVIKKYLDVMALYKMNTFHWHLTDDQGWRIEIKKYPELTSEKTTVFHHTTNQPAERSGYYTQEQIKEVVAYAKERHITIVPEIDVPGHSWPTLLAYPELGINKNTFPHHLFPFVASWSYWGTQFTPNTLDPTKEIVYEFLDNVFTEITALFPGDYIHFGGDEVRRDFWEDEPHVLEFMKINNIEDTYGLQSYFVTRVSKIIEEKGKKPLGWNDILKDSKNLPRNTAIMSWIGQSAIKEAAAEGFYTVASPSSHLYLDITQESRHDGTMSDLAYEHIITLRKVYEFDPAADLSPTERELLLGVQAHQWPAVPQEVKDINVQNFPRLLAAAEIAWSSPDDKDYDNFYKRVTTNYARLDSLKIDYFRSGGYKVGSWSPNDIKETFDYLTFDITEKVYANGRAQAGFLFTDGDHYLEIDGAELLENGQVISADKHHALADDFRGTNKIKPFFYNFTVDGYNPSAVYEIKARVRGAGGTNSMGNFTFNLSPYKPFKVVEKR